MCYHFLEIYKKIDELRGDYMNGSTTIARNALRIFTGALYTLKQVGELHLISKIAGDIINAKPAMAAPANVIRHALGMVNDNTLEDPASVESHILEEMDNATDITLNTALEYLKSMKKDHVSVASCSYSSTIVKLLTRAHESGMDVSLIAVESKWKGYSYGRILADECSRRGINSRVVPDTDMISIINYADLCLCGADAILPDGSIVNGVPSRGLARAVHGIIPFCTVAESFKRHDKFEEADGFELVYAELVSHVFTDNVFED